MGVYPIWKYFLVIIILIFSLIYSLPNLYTSYPSIEVKAANLPLSREQTASYADSLKNSNIIDFSLKTNQEKSY